MSSNRDKLKCTQQLSLIQLKELYFATDCHRLNPLEIRCLINHREYQILKKTGFI